MKQRMNIEVQLGGKHLTIEQHVNNIMEEKQCTSKEAIKEVAIQRGLSKERCISKYHVE